MRKEGVSGTSKKVGKCRERIPYSLDLHGWQPYWFWTPSFLFNPEILIFLVYLTTKPDILKPNKKLLARASGYFQCFLLPKVEKRNLQLLSDK